MKGQENRSPGGYAFVILSTFVVMQQLCHLQLSITFCMVMAVLCHLTTIFCIRPTSKPDVSSKTEDIREDGRRGRKAFEWKQGEDEEGDKCSV